MVCARPKHSKIGALRHRQLHAGRSDRPELFFQAKVFHELNASSVELLQIVFCVIAPSPFMSTPSARFFVGQQSGRHVDLCQVQFLKEVVSFSDHRFLSMFDSHQELCVPGAGLCIFKSTKLCLSYVKLCAIFVAIEVCVLAEKHDFLNISRSHEIRKNTTALVYFIWAELPIQLKCFFVGVLFWAASRGTPGRRRHVPPLALPQRARGS